MKGRTAINEVSDEVWVTYKKTKDQNLRNILIERYMPLVKSISAADEKVAETQGLNRNGIRANEAGYNGTCYVADADGRLAPLTQDWTRK